MAKMTRLPDGGVFYDAFGGKLGEVEIEDLEYAGDSFHRSDLDCYAAASSAADKVYYVNSCNSAIGNVAISSTVDLVQDELSNIRDRLQALESQAEMRAKSKLRTQLKTLQYSREVQ